MTHPPQEVLLKVMCSDKEPDNEVLCEDGEGNQLFGWLIKTFHGNFICESEEHGLDDVLYYYEPATRIVLTEEEYSGICMKQYDEGYSDATKEARDEIANNYRPNDN